MKRRLLLRLQVPDDLEGTIDYLRQTSPEAAVGFFDAYKAATVEIREHPGRGSIKLFRLRKLQGVRSWQLRGFSNYLVLYIYSDEAVTILAVAHGARDLERLLRDRI